MLRWHAILTPPNGPVWYHVYENTGLGDPINYASPLATVTGLTWTSGALSYPGTWQFGVRAFWRGSGLEEQDLEAAVTIILDANGHDITSRPVAPMGLRAFATVGGAVRVEWGYPNVSGAKLPTGFHVYITSPLSIGGPLCPTVTTRRNVRRPGGGDARWRRGDGGSAAYGTPTATVSFASSIMGSWVCNLTGLTNGMAYVIGVRAFNATAEEQNTTTVNVTAAATGPAAVDSLTASAS